MKAKKENKVYNIDEVQKQAYLKEGYDVYDDNGKIIEYSPKKTVSYNEYAKVIKQVEELKNNNSNAELTKQVEILTSEKTKLTKTNAELTKQVEILTSEKTELTKALKESKK